MDSMDSMYILTYVDHEFYECPSGAQVGLYASLLFEVRRKFGWWPAADASSLVMASYGQFIIPSGKHT